MIIKLSLIILMFIVVILISTAKIRKKKNYTASGGREINRYLYSVAELYEGTRLF